MTLMYIFCRRLILACWLVAAGPLVLAGCDRAVEVPATSLPAGAADWFRTGSGLTLRQAAPGVLANDRYLSADSVALLERSARWGAVNLEPTGAFTYEPTFRFYGQDSFTYRIVDGDYQSEPVLVQIGFPNVIVIVTDDMGFGDYSANNAKLAMETPNIDALAKAGMSFNHAHAPAAVCAPSRYALLTGNYPYRGRLSTGVWGAYEPSTMILPGQSTLGDVFNGTGYRTGIIGKLHIGGAFWNQAGTEYTRDPLQADFTRRFNRGPLDYGFDYSFLLPGGLSGPPYAYFENDRLVRFDQATQRYEPFATHTSVAAAFSSVSQGWAAPFNGGLLGGPGLVLDNYDSRHSGAILTRKALEFMEQSIASSKGQAFPEPFFLLFAPPQLHTPYTPPDFFNISHRNDAAPATTGIPVAGETGSPRNDIIREIDLMVGAIVSFLAERGELERTLIVFTSDNGPLPDPGTEGTAPQGTEAGVPLRDSKGSIYEGGHRVPLLLRWGDGTSYGSYIPPGSATDQLVGLQDLAATFHALLGQQRASGQFNDSKNLLPVALGTLPESKSLRDHLIVQGSPKSAADNRNYIDRAFYKHDASGHRWKLTVVSSHTDPASELAWGELFNLTADPGERIDLSKQPEYEQQLAVMKSEYLQLLNQPRTVINYR